MKQEEINTLQTILREKNSNFRNLIDNFLKWYFFFWTLNVTGIAGIYTGIDVLELKAKHLIALVFIVINILAFLIIIITFSVAQEISKESIEISKKMLEVFNTSEETFKDALCKPPYPILMINSGFPSCAVSIISLIFLWLYFIIT